jgi:hypothetical protein
MLFKNELKKDEIMRKQSNPILVESKRNPQEYRHLTPADLRSHHEHSIRKIEKE